MCDMLVLIRGNQRVPLFEKNILNNLMTVLLWCAKSEIMSHLLILHLQDMVHGDDPSAGEVLAVLAHLDGLQPLRHRSEGGTVWTAGAGQTDGYTASKEKLIQMIMINRLSHNKGGWLSTVITVEETSWGTEGESWLRPEHDSVLSFLTVSGFNASSQRENMHSCVQSHRK